NQRNRRQADGSRLQAGQRSNRSTALTTKNYHSLHQKCKLWFFYSALYYSVPCEHKVYDV
ncbi:hypothetical protein, partial [uncultured Phascolarctobacterium sp.]|uniref:hypothetical protein n=1 Tax=uncultured Phascolarctobacterium sp. TaxID=512296 RepID=UPI002614EE1D